MKGAFCLFFSLIFFNSVSAQVSEAPEFSEAPEGEIVFSFRECPNVCVDMVQDSSLFDVCADLRQSGCSLLTCNKPNVFSCRLPTDEVPSERIEIVPGSGESQEIVFDTLTVDTPFPFFIKFEAKPLPTDIYLLADNTGSMLSTISTVQKEFGELISEVRSDSRFTKPRFGVGSYQDERTSGTDFGFTNIQPFTEDTDLAQDAVNRYIAVGGGDPDEANLVALYKVATDPKIGWRNISRKIIVYFGDVPGHEPTCGDFGGATRLTRNEVVAELERKRISVIGISLNGGGFNSAPRRSFGCTGPTVNADPGQSKFITDSTRGVLREGNANDIINDIVKAINQLPSTFTADDSDCNGKLKSVYDPNLPFILAPGDSGEVKQTVSVPEEICQTNESEFTCEIKYLESGVNLPPTIIRAKKITGCPEEQ